MFVTVAQCWIGGARRSGLRLCLSGPRCDLQRCGFASKRSRWRKGMQEEVRVLDAESDSTASLRDSLPTSASSESSSGRKNRVARSKSSDEGVADSNHQAASKERTQQQWPHLFTLPLYRKPAFPGFYQIIQVSDQELVDFLQQLRKSGNEYLAGFMTKKAPPEEADEGSAEGFAAFLPQEKGGAGGGGGGGNSSSSMPSSSQMLRRDAGRVETVDELEEVGTVLQMVNLTYFPNVPGGQVVVMPHKRVRRTGVVPMADSVPLPALTIEYLPKAPDEARDNETVKALYHEIIATMKELLKTNFIYKEQFEQVIRFHNIDDPLRLGDLVAGMSMAQRDELQNVLAENDPEERLRQCLTVIKKDFEFSRLQSKVKGQVEEKVTKEQRKYMLMEQMKQIKKELGIEKDDKTSIIQTFRDAIEGKEIPEEANKVLEHELGKLQTLDPSSSEFNIVRTYLEWLTAIPWGKQTVDNADIGKAEATLNEDHYGLEDVKERILEHMAVSFLRESVTGKIMCLVGPPGVGKTSVGKSIARALDRKFFRFSVGGLHDVAEIRGHRRTYVGAMPGKLIQCVKITQSMNPVILLDEVDKLGRDYRGDPSSALLEILDQEQNTSFRDHYLDVPVDLSKCLFICTANVTDSIPGPLLDRMEVIRIAGYTFQEKAAIAKQYLLPQARKEAGLKEDDGSFGEECFFPALIKNYAREAGVRQLQKLIEKVCRKVALRNVRNPDAEIEPVSPDNLSKYVGQPIFPSDALYSGGAPVGTSMGLAWTALGGASLFIEARGSLRRPLTGKSAVSDTNESISGSPGSGGGGSLEITGQIGNVMSESSRISHTYAKLFLQELDYQNDYLESAKVHLNVPEGSVPKDGPSAGITMTASLLSLSLNQPLRSSVAMTGELTLNGLVLRVGGIKEKTIAARRENVTELIFPMQNKADFMELQEYIREGVTAHFVDHFDEVYKLAFEDVPALPGPSRGTCETIQTPPASQDSSGLKNDDEHSNKSSDEGSIKSHAQL
eukprot:gnl/MRDRNA2_/MRDRNA2_97719_c0_seq1.p1 gnl/MRDRNA2_/MRDRNA2_97719_c0~~gnl/MRDRNA2_/MRDRNA2_97719_c0_seq1.p1  ORF type:complete len:1009 (+),score=190.06 gnl/MRDRNA2_/MRDRNA2_97719_c0_seq1:74-3100(+)